MPGGADHARRPTATRSRANSSAMASRRCRYVLSVSERSPFIHASFGTLLWGVTPVTRNVPALEHIVSLGHCETPGWNGSSLPLCPPPGDQFASSCASRRRARCSRTRAAPSLHPSTMPACAGARPSHATRRRISWSPASRQAKASRTRCTPCPSEGSDGGSTGRGAGTRRAPVRGSRATAQLGNPVGIPDVLLHGDGGPRQICRSALLAGLGALPERRQGGSDAFRFGLMGGVEMVEPLGDLRAEIRDQPRQPPLHRLPPRVRPGTT